uniref:hypothetical protein n=2 Tax=Bifidobacterium TaxID=1678 RepID=UPI00359CA863
MSDDSNELVPTNDGDDNVGNTENDNADPAQNITIIQDEQGITFLGDAGAIDL